MGVHSERPAQNLRIYLRFIIFFIFLVFFFFFCLIVFLSFVICLWQKIIQTQGTMAGRLKKLNAS